MKARLIFLVPAAALTLALASCAPAPTKAVVSTAPTAPAETMENNVPTPPPSPTPETSPPPSLQVRQADVPPGEYAPWQEGYAAFLSELRQKEGELKNWMDSPSVQEQDEDMERQLAYNSSSTDYCLYDADKDGVPELFVRYGNCEADYHTTCYTFQNGQVVEAGDFPSGHGMIYSCPGDSAFLFSWGHMGYGGISKFPMRDGTLVEEEILLEEDCTPFSNNGEWKSYTSPGDLLPGAECVPCYYTPTRWRPWDSPALLLPIYDYGSPYLSPAPLEEAEVRSLIGKALWADAPLLGVSGDGFHGDTGPVTLSEYLQPGMAYPYHSKPLKVTRYAFAGVNGDDQTDCVLQLEESPDENGNAGCPHYTVLSVEDGTVYAYFFDSIDRFGLDPDGTVYLQRGGQWDQISFYKNQCYRFPARQDPVEGCDLAWDIFP